MIITEEEEERKEIHLNCDDGSSKEKAGQSHQNGKMFIVVGHETEPF